MNADEIITRAESFAKNFIAKLQDKTEQPERKQVFFLDTQDELKKYMGALQKIANMPVTTDVDGGVDTDEELLVTKAGDILEDIKNAISEYQKELMVSPDTAEEDTTVSLTTETISEAMKTNKTTQEISANMTAIAEQQKANALYNYALSCDGQLFMFNATTKDELNTYINNAANSNNYKDIQLFKMQFTPVPLKKKTVLSV